MNGKTRNTWQWILGIAFAAGLLYVLYMGAHEYEQYVWLMGKGGAGVYSAGKVLGLLAAYLFLWQFGLSGRILFLDRVFGVDRLLATHAVLGAGAMCAAVLHPLVLYAPEAVELGAIRWELIPEGLGFLGIVIAVLIVVTTLWRGFLQMRYENWRRVHDCAFVLVVLVMVHAYILGSDFTERGAVFWIFTAMCILYAGLFIWVKLLRPMLLPQWEVQSCREVGRGVYEIAFSPCKGKGLALKAGQFVFLRFLSGKLGKQEHPFTVCSQPDSEQVHLAIKKSGDYTTRIDSVQEGDRATLEGPFGRFGTDWILKGVKDERLVLIAGGVGITPIMSNLRTLAKQGYPGQIVLIWSIRKADDLFYAEEIEGMKQQLAGLTVFITLTGEQQEGFHHGRLSREMLDEMIGPVCKEDQVMLCGPGAMMNQTRALLLDMGMRKGQIHTEAFTL